MSYLVLARKYRPQTFDEVVGQEHIATTLKNSILSERVAHAYLFAGSRGIGKTSMARIFAKALNCPQAEEAEPCNDCEVCETISQGSDIDVIEIDGASHRGVDDVSLLRDGTKYMPSRGDYKIYIIDEVHMLTRHAFNALLKTLEEPPDHVKFIFATTEPNKVPDTILSRCQRFDFKRITPADIVKRLSQIVEREGVEVEEQALYQIARAANGGMRDSQSLLDQAFSFCGEEISSEDISKILGVLPGDDLHRFLGYLLAGEEGEVLQFIDEIYWKGVDLTDFLDQVAEGLRNIMLAATLGEKGRDLSGNDLHQIWLDLAQKTDVNQVLLYLQVLSSTREKVKFDSQPRIVTEMAFVYLTRLESFSSLPKLLEKSRSLPAPSPGARATTSPQKRRPKKSSKKKRPSPSGPAIKGKVEDNWDRILGRVRKDFPGYATSLSKGEFVKEEGGKIFVSFSPVHGIHREIVEKPGNKKEIEGVIQDVTKENYTLQFIESDGGKGQKGKKKQKNKIDAPPIVLKAMETFSGELILKKPKK